MEYVLEKSGLTLTNRVDPESIGQFTGLCDIDGNEIYEGDILSYDFVEKVCDIKYHHKGESVVSYFEGVAGFIFYDEDNEDYDFNQLSHIEISKQNLKVVGNVFQNKIKNKLFMQSKNPILNSIMLLLYAIIVIVAVVFSIYLVVDAVVSLINGTGTALSITMEIAGAVIGVPICTRLLYYILVEISRLF